MLQKLIRLAKGDSLLVERAVRNAGSEGEAAVSTRMATGTGYLQLAIEGP